MNPVAKHIKVVLFLEALLRFQTPMVLIKVTDSHKLHINCFRLTIKVVLNKTLKTKELFYKKKEYVHALF